MRVPTATYIKQKVRAIRAINETMQKPNSIPNDYTITAVAIMTILEVCRFFLFLIFKLIHSWTERKRETYAKQCLAGEPTAWAIHKQGLDKMIQSRGGIQNLDLEGAAPRTVSWFVAPLTIFFATCLI